MKIKYYSLAFFLLVFSQCKEKQAKQNAKIDQGITKIVLDRPVANKLSKLAFHCIDTEYPNKLGQVIGGPDDLREPKELRPAFYGCFDWHSAVHGHWTLVKLLKLFPDLEMADSIRIKIARNITPANIASELEFWKGPHNKSFERTYGWNWLLKLQHELDSWEDPQGQQWANNLRPMSQFLVTKYQEFLPKLNYPIRVGEHSNTAFGLSYAIDYAQSLPDSSFYTFLKSRAIDYYQKDSNCPIDWEPSGYDFLSPCLEEAHLMSKIMDNKSFGKWWESFVDKDQIYSLQPATSMDLTDGKLVHLVGLNFSRAWCIFGIANILNDSALAYKAEEHILASIDDVINGDYAGEHWLASFTVMAITARRHK